MRNSTKIVRDAAEKAGRDPMSVRIYHNIIVAPDLPKAEEEAVVGGRAITYFELPGFGDLIVDINGWDKTVLDAIRAHPKIAGLNGKYRPGLYPAGTGRREQAASAAVAGRRGRRRHRGALRGPVDGFPRRRCPRDPAPWIFAQGHGAADGRVEARSGREGALTWKF
ncbi:hypothetical protein ACFSLT_30770 [Novosphingobium resinovorum]